MQRLLLACTIAAFALPAHADTRLQQALKTQDGPIYAYDFNFARDGDSLKMRVDPAKPIGQRVTLLSPAKEKLTENAKKMVDRVEKNSDGNIWCAQFSSFVSSDAKLASETDKTAVYSFTPKPPNPKDQFAKAYKFLKGEVTIDKTNPQILSFSMKAPGAFKPMSVAKVDRFILTASCARAPDGRTYPTSMNMDLAAKAMMQSITQKESRQTSNLAKVAETSSFGTK
jgi:hypothetical protein